MTYRGKLIYKKRIFPSGSSKVIILPTTFLKFLKIEKEVEVYLNPIDKSIVIKKAENDRQIQFKREI